MINRQAEPGDICLYLTGLKYRFARVSTVESDGYVEHVQDQSGTFHIEGARWTRPKSDVDVDALLEEQAKRDLAYFETFDDAVHFATRFRTDT